MGHFEQRAGWVVLSGGQDGSNYNMADILGRGWDGSNHNVYIQNPTILGGGIPGNLNYNSTL